MPNVNEKTPLLQDKLTNTKSSVVKQVLSRVTVEPALLLRYLGLSVELLYRTQMTIDKICLVHFGYSLETCQNLASPNHVEKQDRVQRLASQYSSYYYLVEYFPALLTSIVLGSWGDARSRRVPVILPVVGGFLSSLCFLANAYWWRLPTPLLIVSMLPLGLCGGSVGMSTAANAYLSATSGDRSRTTKLSAVEWCKNGCFAIGVYVCMQVYRRGGYVAVFTFEASVYILAVIYIIVCLKEPASSNKDDSGASRSVWEVLSPSRLKTTFTVAFKRSDGGSSVPTVAHTFIILLCILISSGSKAYFYLFARKMFDWEYEEYTYWLIIYYMSATVGQTVLMPLLSYYWKVEDGILGFMGGASYLFLFVMYATAPFPWVLYLAAGVSLFRDASIVSSRGRLSKLVGENEYGALFALLAVVECVVLFASPFLYTFIYNTTLDFFPGTVFLVLAGFSVVICCVDVWLLTHYQQEGVHT